MRDGHRLGGHTSGHPDVVTDKRSSCVDVVRIHGQSAVKIRWVSRIEFDQEVSQLIGDLFEEFGSFFGRGSGGVSDACIIGHRGPLSWCPDAFGTKGCDLKRPSFSRPGFFQGTNRVRVHMLHDAGFQFTGVIARIVEYGIRITQRPPVCRAQENRRLGLELAKHLPESIGAVAIDDQQFGHVGILDRTNEVGEDQHLCGRIQVERKGKVPLLRVDSEGNSREDDHARSLLGGFGCGLFGNGLHLPGIRGMRQVSIVRFGGTPGQDGNLDFPGCDIGPGQVRQSDFHGAQPDAVNGREGWDRADYERNVHIPTLWP